MGSDAASIGSLPANSKIIRANVLGKSRQSRVGGVRRESCISDGNNKNDEVGSIGVRDGPSHPTVKRDYNLDRGRESLLSSSGEEKQDDAVSVRNRSVDHGVRPEAPSKTLRSSSRSCDSCSSGSTSEEDKDDGVLDDWEAVADALNIENVQPSSQDENNSNISDDCKLANDDTQASDLEANKALKRNLQQTHNSAWRPDDAFRPQSLPSITTKCSRVVNGTLPTVVKHQARVVNGTLPAVVKPHVQVVNSKRGGAQGGGAWLWRRRPVAPQQPTSCPICYEDLDLTDRCFHPCPCGFQVCLFCHKRIREDDGRCPGCRKQYEAIDVGTGIIARAPLGVNMKFML